MADRYMGREDLTNTDQVVDYIVSNFVDEDGDELAEAEVRTVCDHDEAWELIQGGVANRSFVYYIGDIIAEKAGYGELDDFDEEDDDDDAG